MNKYITEFLGTLFLFLAVGSTVVGSYSADLGPIVVGGTLIALVYMGGPISRAHYNPAVSLAFWLLKKCSSRDTIIYIISQLLGAWVALGVLAILFPLPEAVQMDVSGRIPQAFLAELVGTLMLVTVILNVAVSKRTAGNGYYGVAIGLTVMGGAFLFGVISGAAFNPAVAISMVGMKFLHVSQIWVHLTSQAVAAFVGVFLFKIMNPDG